MKAWEIVTGTIGPPAAVATAMTGFAATATDALVAIVIAMIDFMETMTGMIEAPAAAIMTTVETPRRGPLKHLIRADEVADATRTRLRRCQSASLNS
jgi:NADH:ubiquinone oxidoreductase subunit D